jgi:hypothetical protein
MTPENLNPEPEHEHKHEELACACPECDPANLKHKPAEITDEQYWTAVGKFYGYPDCCIKEFLVNASQMLPPEGVRKQAAHRGFVPCENHSRELLQLKVSYSGLLKNRICPMPLDNTPWEESYASFILDVVLPSLLQIPDGTMFWDAETSTQTKTKADVIKTAIQFLHKTVGKDILQKHKELYELHQNTINNEPASS